MPTERDPPINRPCPLPDLAPRWERDPLTPELLQEASIPPTWLPTILSLRPPPSPSPTPVSSSAKPAPITTGGRRAARLATIRSQHRIGADNPKPISAETYIEHRIILAVINERRRLGGHFEGWAAEARDIIDQVVPSRRQLLEQYAHMRHVIRTRRTTWKLQEHLPELGDIADTL